MHNLVDPAGVRADVVHRVFLVQDVDFDSESREIEIDRITNLIMFQFQIKRAAKKLHSNSIRPLVH